MRLRCGVLLALPLAAVAPASVEFSHDGQTVLIPYQKKMDLVGETTIEAWVYPEESSKTRYFNYVVSRNYGNGGYGICIQGSDKKVSNIGGPVIPFGQWTHLAMVHGKHALKLYVNGNLGAVIPGDGETQAIPLPMYIGNSNFLASPGDQPTSFFGKIAEVRIWDVALDQAQVRSTMNRFVRSNRPHLVAYFPLIEDKGTLVHDYTGHLISGHLGGDYGKDPNDPAWSADEPPLKGRKPRLRSRSA